MQRLFQNYLDSIKIIANGAVGFGNIDIEAAKKKHYRNKYT